MTKNISFIHTADIHLGSPLNCGGEPPLRLASKFKNAGYQSLQLIIDRALKYEVDFVLIAGDLYDREARSVEASRFFVKQCFRLKKENIPVYIISGNHDPAGREKEPFSLPENVHIFPGEEVGVKEFKNSTGDIQARILGQSYRNRSESRKMYSYYTVPDQNPFNIGLLHSQLDPGNRDYVPVSKNELIQKDDIDYWALGHIHQPRILNYKQPAIVFPGTPQGKDIDETGVRGCFLVQLEKGFNPELKFIPTSRVIFKQIEVNIGEKDYEETKKPPENLTDLKDLMMKKGKLLLKENSLNDLDIIKADDVDESKIDIAGEKRSKEFNVKSNNYQSDNKQLNNNFSVTHNDSNKKDKISITNNVNNNGDNNLRKDHDQDSIKDSENKGCKNDFIKGYIVRWIVKGKGPFHQFIEENREEAISELTEMLNDIFSRRDPFLWTHSISFHTGHRLCDLDSLIENNEIFKEIAQVINDILKNDKLKEELHNCWGEVWKGSSDHEEMEPEKFYPDEQITEEILNEARHKIFEKLLERGGEE